MRNEGEPYYQLNINPQDIGLGFETDEEILSGDNVKGQFDKMEFLNKFQKAVNNVITLI